jgi:phosphonate transport system permease protein
LITASHGRSKAPLWKFIGWVFLIVLVLVSIQGLDWNLDALTTAEGRETALDRIKTFFSSFGSPNLESSYLQEALHLSLQTLATAVLGVGLAIVLGYGIALGASKSVMIGNDPRPGLQHGILVVASYWGRRVVVEVCRFVLDVFRGVPDFVWAILILTIPGPGPVTGILAIGVSVAGILGKIYSEIWDAIPPQRYLALRSTGAGRLSTFFNGVQPLAGRSMLSYTLMRTECAVRNASVIGVVGGGGIGAQLWDEFLFANYANVVTLLIFMLVLTAGVDILSNLLRYQLRNDPNHPKAARKQDRKSAQRRRVLGFGGVAVLLGLAVQYLRHPFAARKEHLDQGLNAFAKAAAELDRIEWGWISKEFGRLLRPDFEWETVTRAMGEALVPLELALIATLAGALIALFMAYPASISFQVESNRFTGEALNTALKVRRWFAVIFARVTGLLFRAVPEVAWLLLFASFFTMGVLPGMIAMTLHTAGILVRVFTETVDNVPFKRLERVHIGSRPLTYAYGAVPASWRDWSTYSLFQFESNVRAGVVLGMLGIGGIGHYFHSAFQFWHLERAATYLIVIILLTVIIDRISRALKLSRVSH